MRWHSSSGAPTPPCSPKVMAPRNASATRRPLLPKVRYRTTHLLSPAARTYRRARGSRLDLAYAPRVPIARPPVVGEAEWQAALADLLKREEAVAAEVHALAAARKRMPMAPVERDYRFEGPGGELPLLDLFEGRTQLILYRFFFEEGVD